MKFIETLFDDVTEKCNYMCVENHGVDPALFSINWFLCLFVDSLPVNTYLHIWDAFLFEGSKVGSRGSNDDLRLSW